MDLTEHLKEKPYRVLYGKTRLDHVDVRVYLWFEGDSFRSVVNTNTGLTVDGVPDSVIDGIFNACDVEFSDSGSMESFSVTDEYARSLSADPNYFMKESCDECDGSGEYEEMMFTECPECYGEGVDEDDDECRTCGGDCEIEEMTELPCEECSGSGRVFRADEDYMELLKGVN